MTFGDSIGRTALNISGLGSVNVSGSSPYNLNWTSVTPTGYSPNLTWVGGARYCTLVGSQPNVPVVSSIVLPNGQGYSFQYDPTYGTVSKITYPTGGYVRYVWGMNHLAEYGKWPATTTQDQYGTCGYQYDTPAILHRYVSFDGATEVLQQDFSYSTSNWSQGNSLWGTKTTTVTTHDLVRSAVYNTVYTYNWKDAGAPPNTSDYPRQVPVEQTVVYKNPNGNTLRTENKNWLNERLLIQQQTTLENGQLSEIDWSYDGNPWTKGQIIGPPSEELSEKDEYDYGSGVRGALLRKTLTSYVWDTSGWPNQQALSDAHILDKPATVQVLNGAGAVVAGVSHQYDPKANLLQYQQWLNPNGSQYLTTSHSYDGYGNALSTTDPLNNTTTYSYADNYRVTCPGVSSSNAFLTTITYPNTGVAHTESFSYDCPTGKLASSTDQNSKTTSYQYNDLLNRLTSISYPDTGSTTYSYNDSHLPTSNPSVTENEAITSSLTKAQESILDGFGREIQSQLTSDPEGVDKTDTSYDGLGRKASVGNPYRGTVTDGTIQYYYDVLDRPSSVVQQDGGTIAYSYSGNTATTIDEAGKKRTTQMDALGRLSSVTEDPSVSNYLTVYQYDALDNLTCVEQHGGVSSTGCAADPSQDASSAWRVRRFTYDQLSRLLSAKNPEIGTISYGYDAASNLITKTDPRPITITYTPDALHRITQKSYSNGEFIIKYCYDNQQAACGTSAASNGIGRRTGMLDVSGSTAWSYDVMGRPTAITKSVGGVSTPTNYAYNLDGSIWQMVFPGYSFDTITYTYSGAGRPITATYDDPYLFWSFDYVKSATYTASGALVSYQSHGFSGSDPTVTNSYNKRLQPVTMSATTSQGNVLNLTYSFNLQAGDNGNVYGITNNLDSSRSQTFAYDALNRLQSAGTSSTWGDNYGYDAWGNLLSKTVTRGSAETWSQPADGKNRISAWGYDLAGNQNSVSGHVYNIYNAENQWTMQTAYHVNYVYDGDGRKVKDWGGASGMRISVDDTAGRVIMELDQSGTTLNEYLYFGDSRIARVNTEGGPVYYYYGDHLGTARVITDGVGNKCYDADYFPWGLEQHVYVNSCPQNYKFTGKERDPDTSSDYFGARWYRYDMSRFFSPDWSSTPTGVPYANFGNPQSLNLYAYVINNPLRTADSDGHEAGLCYACGPGGTTLSPLDKNYPGTPMSGAEKQIDIGILELSSAFVTGGATLEGGTIVTMLTNAIATTGLGVSGTTRILATASGVTPENVERGATAATTVSTPAGLAVTLGTRNMKAGAVASDAASLASMAKTPAGAVKDPAGTALTVSNVVQDIKTGYNAVKSFFSPPSPPPPAPPPAPKKESCPQCV